ETFLKKFIDVKAANKQRLADYLLKTQGVVLRTDAIFDVQAKRMHEYKRQLLKCLHILYLYNKIKENPEFLTQPISFIFACKAAPGYIRAKSIIRLINVIADLVNNDPDTKNILQVVFIENYSVSAAEILMPAADLSEQISTAGLEASGTGNMKFMMNGAVTIGTMDGANIEIFEQVGKDNIYIFGAKEEEIDVMMRHKSYHPGEYYEKNLDIRKALNKLIDGSLPNVSAHKFSDIYQSILFGEFNFADRYFLLYDFQSYVTTFDKARHKYQHDPIGFAKMAAINTAMSGYFSSDRTISEYNEKIWHLTKLDADKNI
ncbi:MAG: glycogen/starch/alpha-glucan phosphorylase, partial [Oscillospiraceae bacterium]